MVKDLTYQIQFQRVFILQNLPEPLTRASEHLQFFDNYIENTRLCLRTIRAPHTKKWSWILEQRFPIDENDLSRLNVARIYLSDAEHQVFEQFEGREVQKNERIESNELRLNRYFYDYNGTQIEIDMFLNPLWGLCQATAIFETAEEMQNFQPPEFASAEITQNKFFAGANLIGKTFADIQIEFEEIKKGRS
jgi:hypothetical protein